MEINKLSGNHKRGCHSAPEPRQQQFKVFRNRYQRKKVPRKVPPVSSPTVLVNGEIELNENCFENSILNVSFANQSFGDDSETRNNGIEFKTKFGSATEEKLQQFVQELDDLENESDDVDLIYLGLDSSKRNNGRESSLFSRNSTCIPIVLDADDVDSLAETTLPSVHHPTNCWENTRTISRTSSSRKSGTASAATSKSKTLQTGSDTESDVELSSREVTSDLDFKKVDIFDDKAWDTDLEGDDNTPTYDHSGKTAYIEACKLVGVIPVSYFLRHMQDNKVNLSHHGLGANGMKAIAMSLVSNTEITELNLADNWLGFTGGMAVCQMLKENCFISHLDLSDNKLNYQCAQSLCEILLQNDTLRHVILTGNDFDDKSAVHFANTIMLTKTLEYLNLSKNNFCETAGVVFGPAISENSCIKELDLSWNHIRRRGAVSVAQGVKTNVFMKKINLSWNGFGVEGAFAVGDALKGNSVLEDLDISNNRINTEGAVIIGKGLAVNETLKVLKIGKNPMQSAGCWGICAAILKNPNCILETLDFSDILVNQDFNEIFKKVQEQFPELKMRHGGMEPPLNPKARVHPMVKLHSYIQKNNLRLVDFFNKFDKDKSMSVTHEEFLTGLVETGINLTEEETQQLLEELDRDGDGEINYSELVIGHTDFQEKERQMNMVISSMRPITT
ncbi:leucine-rich repeat-containing protein 74A isoform X1 [Patella vulgata]|uniref:leucine-rich repeat-containing protein 74A isoform X1 n=1 Tax=Patella vulgata TaxID=6465 RepID=UPI00217F8F18|nr:leucine-rich repeat-containing protein 74A isoform X1 [Patella vulgata]XP_055957906.1 leucine-rich repeat-containing protein 74A isoform X1 [Patella vulgata]